MLSKIEHKINIAREVASFKHKNILNLYLINCNKTNPNYYYFHFNVCSPVTALFCPITKNNKKTNKK